MTPEYAKKHAKKLRTNDTAEQVYDAIVYPGITKWIEGTDLDLDDVIYALARYIVDNPEGTVGGTTNDD